MIGLKQLIFAVDVGTLRSLSMDEVERLTTQFGARVEVSFTPGRKWDDKIEHTRERMRVKEQVMGCRACELQPQSDLPVPFSGPANPLFAVMGEAPGRSEMREGEPFVGKSGQVIRKLFREFGWNDRDMVYLNTVQCMPLDENGKIRPPIDTEMRACVGNVDSIMRVANTDYMLLLGASSLHRFRADLKIGRQHGQLFKWNIGGGNRWVMPTYHPAAILRTPSLRSTVREDLARWQEVVEGSMSPTLLLGVKCQICEGHLSHYDPNGVPYCRDHTSQERETWRKQKRRWEVEVKEQGTLSL